MQKGSFFKITVIHVTHFQTTFSMFQCMSATVANGNSIYKLTLLTSVHTLLIILFGRISFNIKKFNRQGSFPLFPYVRVRLSQYQYCKERVDIDAFKG